MTSPHFHQRPPLNSLQRYALSPFSDCPTEMYARFLISHLRRALKTQVIGDIMVEEMIERLKISGIFFDRKEIYSLLMDWNDDKMKVEGA